MGGLRRVRVKLVGTERRFELEEAIRKRLTQFDNRVGGTYLGRDLPQNAMALLVDPPSVRHGAGTPASQEFYVVLKK